MRVMGQDPMPPREFREYLRVVRALLDGKEADYTYAGKTRQIKFLHRDRHFVNLDNRIPIYVAANGPKALRATGAYGDGWMTVTSDPEEFRHSMEGVRAGAQEVGRALGPDFHTACVTTACVLRPGEKLTDERVINETGSQVACVLHFAWEIWRQLGKKDELVPPFFANVWDDYLRRVDNYSLPETARFRQIHDGHCTFLQPEERRFITPEAIAAVCVVGTPEEIIHKLHAMEKAGIKEIALLPPADYQRKIFRGIAEMIFPAFR
jgi:alkanesulfonate monooxygenase SsuD/methylene tetrahydromethanopterin reductase-like flavin-dependent oxidoreductase (luciferase family)